jgi:hypothetical protein
LPINDPSALTTAVVYGTQLTIHSQLQAELRTTLSASDELYDVSIVRLSTGNNYMAIITYEAAPPAP